MGYSMHGLDADSHHGVFLAPNSAFGNFARQSSTLFMILMHTGVPSVSSSAVIFARAR